MRLLFVLLPSVIAISTNGQQEDENYLPVKGEITPELQQYMDSADFNLSEELNYPLYPNGMNGVIQDIIKNFKYPKKARKEGIEGRAYVSFVVETDGKVREAKVLNNVDDLLAQEAIRVIKKLDRWKPATLEGKNVRMAFVIPINFKL
jgi:TonB family protein